MKKPRNNLNILRGRINRAIDYLATNYLYGVLTRVEILEIIDILCGKDQAHNRKENRR